MSIIALCILTINLIYCEKIYSLPRGVDRVEIGNWTKTREVYEIKEDEKKLNSEYFTGIRNINFDDSLNQVEILNNLYETENRKLRTVNDLNFNNKIIIKGNKVLRGKINFSDPFYFYNYNTIKSWVGSDVSTIWEGGPSGSKIITWKPYVEILEYKSDGSPVEWRMLEGTFQLNKEQLELISSKKVQPVIGIESDDFNLILPFCDLMNVFINEEITDINYISTNAKYRFKVGNSNDSGIYYQNINIPENKKYCNEEVDNKISTHTHNKHIDCNALKSTTNKNYYYNMVGDISQYIKPDISEYKISLLMGQLGRMGENILDYNGGISKITLFLIENPQFNISIKPYIVNEDNKKTDISEDYKFSYGEKILFDVEIVNTSNNYDFSNLDLNINLIKDKLKNSDVLKLNKSVAKYNNIDIRNNINLYLNDENTPTSISELSNLNKGDKITISSDKFVYTVTEYNSFTEKIDYDYIFQFNYLNNYIFYKYVNTNRLQAKPIGGKVTVAVKSDEEDYFYLRLIGEENSSNIKIKSNELYTICNLDYEKEYELLLINSSSYKPVSSQKFVLKNTYEYNKKSINIDVNKKPNNFFTQRKINEILITGDKYE